MSIIVAGSLALSSISSPTDPSEPDLFLHSQERPVWVSPENPSGAKGQGGKSNKGAKGDAFLVVQPGATAVLADIKGTGILRRIWMSGTIPRNPEQRRQIKIEMYWDGSRTPAVECPIGDFFGVGLGAVANFENALFSNPEGKSFNASVPMPFHKRAKVKIVNESDSVALVWYDINLGMVDRLPKEALYFHASWRREAKTVLGRDFEILPKVEGKGRFLGSNIGVVGSPEYNGTWFGEGEAKIFLDGDDAHPSLVGTGTEDYIGTGWGQGVYAHRSQGSLISDSKNDLYAFYRFHLDDHVFFQKDCRVTLQQIGNTSVGNLKKLIEKGTKVKPVWIADFKGQDVMKMQSPGPDLYRLLDLNDPKLLDDPKLQDAGCNFYRSDDVSATAYFYLDKPSNNLPRLTSKQNRPVWKD